MVVPYIEESDFYNFSFQNRNISRYQNIIYDTKKKFDLILFGSSMSASFNTKTINENSINLSAEGETIFSGIKIDEKTEIEGKSYLIEINALYRSDENRLTDIILNPAKFLLRKHIKQFRENYRPDDLLASIIMRIEDKLNFKFYKNESKILSERFQAFNNLNDSLLIIENIRKLETFIKKKQNQNIILFELPFDDNLEKSKKAVFIRRKIRDLASFYNILFIEIPENMEFNTPDYIHMELNSMREFESYLRSELIRITL